MIAGSTKWTTLLGRVSLIAVLSSGNIVNAYTWPNPLLEELDGQLHDRQGYNARTLPSGMQPNCSAFVEGPQAGRANVADWIRTAYHDVATHNIADGSGGLDASIRFETDRAENTGNGFQNTIEFLAGASNRYFTLSDNIALATVTAIEMCGGPKIAYRGGRIDATTPNTPGVPEPQQPINEHIANFARQGFNQEDMIGLVACGHSFGGVQHISFPDAVPPTDDPMNTSGNVHFDSTFVQFDNKVVTEYLKGTTTNPLVASSNVTMRSDFRIFNSDRNRTMSKFANPNVFRDTCAGLFARMIDTVPKTVKLSEVIKPLQVKPVGFQLMWLGNGQVSFKGEVRLWNKRENPRRQVKLLWKGRNGRTSSQFTTLLTHDPSHTTDPLVPGSPSLTSIWYDITNVTLNSKDSISNFWFQIDEGPGPAVTVNQGGIGYPIQDVVMLSNATCFTMGAGGNQVSQISLTLAVRSDIKPSRIYIKSDVIDSTNMPVVNITDISLSSGPLSSDSGYNIWTAPPMAIPQRGWNVAVDANGNTYESTFVPSGASVALSNFNFGLCPQ